MGVKKIEKNRLAGHQSTRYFTRPSLIMPGHWRHLKAGTAIDATAGLRDTKRSAPADPCSWAQCLPSCACLLLLTHPALIVQFPFQHSLPGAYYFIFPTTHLSWTIDS